MNDNELIQALEQKKADIRAKAEQSCNAIDLVIASIMGNAVGSQDVQAGKSTTNGTSGESEVLSDRQKIANVLKSENRFLHVREIAKKLHEAEPHISVAAWIKKVSPALSVLKGRGAITKIVVGNHNQNTFWGKETWKDAEGNALPEHMYNEEYVLKAESLEL